MSFVKGRDDFLQKDKAQHFEGSAKVPITQLDFLPSTLDVKNIVRLRQIFNLEGCFRLDPANRIPAIVTQSEIKKALDHAKLQKSRLTKPNSIPLYLAFEGTKLLCLYGRHRIAAVKDVLNAGDRWWTIDLYSGGFCW